MHFDIRFTSSPHDGSTVGNGVVDGELVFGSHTEAFQSFIGFWSPSDYVAQWQAGVAVAARLRLPSCLITSITDPSHAKFLRWWLLYPSGTEVVFQEALLLLKELASPFSTQEPYKSVPKYSQNTEDGERISEWVVPIGSLSDFLESRS